MTAFNLHELAQKIAYDTPLTADERQHVARVLKFAAIGQAALVCSQDIGGHAFLTGWREGESEEGGHAPMFAVIALDDPHPETWQAVRSALSGEECGPDAPVESIGEDGAPLGAQEREAKT